MLAADFAAVHTTRQWWRRFRFDRIEAAFLNSVGIMAFGAGPPPFFPTHFPFASALAVKTRPPFTVGVTVTATAELMRFIKANRLLATINKGVAVGGVMAVQTPDCAPAMLQFCGIADDVLMHLELARLIGRSGGLVCAGMTAAALHGCFEVLHARPDDCLGKIAVRLIAELRHFTHRHSVRVGIAVPKDCSGGR